MNDMWTVLGCAEGPNGEILIDELTHTDSLATAMQWLNERIKHEGWGPYYGFEVIDPNGNSEDMVSLED